MIQRKTLYIPLLFASLVMMAVFLFADRYIARHMEGTDAFQKMFYLLALLNGVMAVGGFFLLKVKKLRLETVFLPVALILGMTYSLMIPPVAAPDESLHLGFVYAEAEKMRGWDTDEYNEDRSVGTQFLRRIEAEHGLQQGDINAAYYAELFPRLKEKEESGELVELKYSNNHEVPHIVYWPGAVGVNLGRSLRLGAVPTFYLGRFFNLLVFLFAGFYALRRMPFGKELLFAVMLLPMVLQEVNSFSCDSMILSMAFLAAALIFHFAYDEISFRRQEGKYAGKPDPVVIIDLGLLGVASFLLAECKYGACLPVCLLALLIPLRRWKSAKKNRSSDGITVKTGRLLSLIVIVMVLLGIFGGFLPSIYQTFHSVVLDNAAAPNYTAGYVLTHPYHIFTILGNTIHTYADHYIYSLIGTSLGWYDIVLPRHLGVFFLVILFFLLIRGKEDRRIEAVSEKVLIGICCFLGVVMAVGGMLIGNTPQTENEIIGVQGRYFLPYFLPFLLLLIPKRITVSGNNEDYARTGIFAVLVLQFVFVMTMFIRAF